MKKYFFIVLVIVICVALAGCGKTTVKDEEKEKTTVKDEEKEKFNNLISNAFIGDIIEFGIYEQDNNEENGKEKIQWRVIDTSNNRVLVVSNNLLDYRSFYEGDIGYWNESSIREWLNSEFLNESFSVEEQEYIPSVNIVTTVYSNPMERFSTDDRVFLMSAEEIEKYFPSRADRLSTPTAYAQEKYDKAKTYDYIRWFTRNHNDIHGGYSHITVNTNKWRSEGLFEEWYYQRPAYIRPAMWIKVSD